MNIIDILTLIVGLPILITVIILIEINVFKRKKELKQRKDEEDQ